MFSRDIERDQGHEMGEELILWVKVFKNGPSKICGRQPLTKFAQSRPYTLKSFKGCLPQILLGPFFNTLTHIMFPNSH